MTPLFIGWTRSFWLGILPSLLIALDVAVTLINGITADASLAPVMALVIAHQRSGSARPYTRDPRARQ